MTQSVVRLAMSSLSVRELAIALARDLAHRAFARHSTGVAQGLEHVQREHVTEYAGDAEAGTTATLDCTYVLTGTKECDARSSPRPIGPSSQGRLKRREQRRTLPAQI